MIRAVCDSSAQAGSHSMYMQTRLVTPTTQALLYVCFTAGTLNPCACFKLDSLKMDSTATLTTSSATRTTSMLAWIVNNTATSECIADGNAAEWPYWSP